MSCTEGTCERKETAKHTVCFARPAKHFGGHWLPKCCCFAGINPVFAWTRTMRRGAIVTTLYPADQVVAAHAAVQRSRADGAQGGRVAPVVHPVVPIRRARTGFALCCAVHATYLARSSVCSHSVTSQWRIGSSAGLCFRARNSAF